MAKTRAQRKAERRAREARGAEALRLRRPLAAESRAQHDTQVPVSGDIAEIEAVEAGMAAGAPEAQLETPDAPKPSRAERRAEEKRRKEAEKRSATSRSARRASSSPASRSRRAPNASAAG